MAVARFFLVLPGLFVLLVSLGAEAGELGVNYGTVADNLPDPAKVVQLLKQHGINTVRLYDANETILTALANTGIKVMVMMPNDEVDAAAGNHTYTLEWVKRNVLRYYPDTVINGVAVGNEVFVVRPDLTPRLNRAMTSVHRALTKLGLAGAVKVSTTIHFSALRDTFPPSSSRFRDDIALPVIKPMVEFFERSGSYPGISMNPYPFFAYALDPQHIPLDYALGNYEPGVVDSNTGLVYNSLLDAMRDATYYAMENLTGRPNVLLTKWSESGWPWHGRLHKIEQRTGKNSRRDSRSFLKNNLGFQPATVVNARAFNNYLINRVLSGNTGTPHHPQADMDVYIFALFNENLKGQGPDDVERHFGLFNPSDMSKVYEFDFHGNSTLAGGGRSSSGGGGGGGGSEVTWCVAKDGVGDERLQAALDYACSHGADCSDIQPGAACFEPNTKAAHASHAFNSYYQRQHHNSGSCDFAGAASVVYQEPRIGNCVLPSRA